MWESWVQIPEGVQIRYTEIRGEDMPQGALVPNATISDYNPGFDDYILEFSDLRNTSFN